MRDPAFPGKHAVRHFPKTPKQYPCAHLPVSNAAGRFHDAGVVRPSVQVPS